MYSRATPFEKSDKLIGTHQKIDRAARLILRNLADEESLDNFPSINLILKFEGKNGPDGIKTKSPGKDEPWHFIDLDSDNQQMINYITNHIHNLSTALAEEDDIRASFEAAWLAHAVTDSLTPAHQYPMGDKIIELSGQLPSDRDNLRKKMLLPGGSLINTARINWQYLGPKGVMSSHMLYELGIATLISPIAPRRFAQKPPETDVQAVLDGEFMDILGERIRLVAAKRYYQRFMAKGWNNRLALETKNELLPQISQTVALSWLAAIVNQENRGL